MRSLSIADFTASAPAFSESLSFYPPGDSGICAEEIEAIRDSLETSSIVEPDSTVPRVEGSVDSFLAAISAEQDTSDELEGDSAEIVSKEEIPDTSEAADSPPIPEPDPANPPDNE